MRDDAHRTSEADPGMRASGAPALPASFLLRAAERALMTLGRDGNGLQVMWTTAARAILLQEEPAPALFIKVYQESTQLEREVATMERALAAGIPVAQRRAFHTGPPAVLITERVGGMPLTSAYPLAAEATGRLLRRFHALGARPPFVDGQRSWSVFIRNWADREIATMVERRAIRPGDGQRLQRHFTALATALSARPCALIHADLQAEHVLIDPLRDRVNALLDFVDTQPGDPLLDIAVLSLWDTGLAKAVLAGYGARGIEQADLLRAYRLLRHLGAANWLTTYGVPAEATRHEHAVHHYLRDLPSCA
jgi:aminoglycoside phosphotransferase (APT) family kinase protein